METIEIYNSLQALMDGIKGRDLNEWIAINCHQVDENPLNATIYVIFEDALLDLEDHLIYENKERGEIYPIELKDMELSYWMTVPMIEDVLSVLKQNHETPDLTLLAKAILHYREYDAFMT